MVITVRRSFPWFPAALAAGWALMLSLTLRDLAWFAAAGASLDGRTGISAVAPIETAAPIKMPVGVAPCAAVGIAPAARTIR